MGLLNFFRRKNQPASPAPTLKEIWGGFQRVLALNNEILGLMGDLEEKLTAPVDLDPGYWRGQINLLDRRLAEMVSSLQSMSGGRWPELEVARVRIQEDLQRRLAEPPSPENLREMLDLLTTLTLVDRRSPNFRPEQSRTYHDLIRFAHEKAIQVMFSLMDRVAQGRVPALKLLKLKTDLPLNLHLVDLGDGLAGYDTPVPPEKIVSRPMRALWRGISHPGIAWAGPVPVNVGGFLHVLGQSAIRPPEQFWDKTYAIVGANYVNYACRLGYHFQSVDCYLGEVPANNYINFTFKGGAADDIRRIRRLRLIATVLERLEFKLEIHGDMLRGRFRRRSAAETEERLDLVGRLMAYVRQMDMLMSDDDIPTILAERFLAGHYERPGQKVSSD
jgi:pyruvate,water dikinase